MSALRKIQTTDSELAQALRLSPAMKVQRQSLGTPQGDAVMIYDGFYADPEAAHRAAVTAKYDFAYPARDAVPSVGNIAVLPALPDLEHFFRQVTGQTGGRFASRFQLNRASEQRAWNIHWDGRAWVGLVYLAKGHDGEPGTAFYRHRRTGIHLATIESLMVAQHVTGLPLDMMRHLLQAEGQEPERWQLLTTVEYHFNRFVLFPADLLHTNSSFWGEQPADARLVHLLCVEDPAYVNPL